MNKFQLIAVAIFLWWSVSIPHSVIAQQPDSIQTLMEADTVILQATPVSPLLRPVRDTMTIVKKERKELSHPKKALLLALVLPGAGQAYNRKYWKMPILYAGVGASVYFLVSNQVGFREFKSAYSYNYQESEKNPGHVVYEDQLKYGSLQVYTSLAQLATDRDSYRRYRDYSIVASVALYAISILDAYVDAHLREFDLSPDLSFSVKPLFYNYNNATFAPGLSLSLKFKNNRTRYTQLYKGEFSNQE